MENKLSKRFSEYLLRENLITPEMFDVYVYGMELLLSFIISTVIILSIGILLHKPMQTIVFLGMFILLRRYTGGYHAKTYLRCKVITISTYLVVIALSELFTPTAIWHILFGIIGFLTILTLGPIENPNKPLTVGEKKKYKIIGLCLFITTLIIGRIIDVQFGNVIYFCLVSVIVLMLITVLLRREDKHEKNYC